MRSADGSGGGRSPAAARRRDRRAAVRRSVQLPGRLVRRAVRRGASWRDARGGLAGGAGCHRGRLHAAVSGRAQRRSRSRRDAVRGRRSGEVVVSQGCRPVGPEMVVTRAEGNILLELAGAPALRKLREVLAGLTAQERLSFGGGPQLGIAMDEYADEHEIGDYLIRAVIGIDEQREALAVGDVVDVGRTVRFQLRDADAARSDLRTRLITAEGRERRAADLLQRPRARHVRQRRFGRDAGRASASAAPRRGTVRRRRDRSRRWPELVAQLHGFGAGLSMSDPQADPQQRCWPSTSAAPRWPGGLVDSDGRVYGAVRWRRTGPGGRAGRAGR